MISNLTVVFVEFLLLRSKVNLDAINDLQYRKAKLAMNLDIIVKYGPKVYFWEEYKYNLRGSRKTAPYINSKWLILKTLSLILHFFLVLSVTS